MTAPELQRQTETVSLATRAALTGISNLLQLGVRLIIGFLITPLIIHGLGQYLYGVWIMLQQTLGYIALADLRAAGTLKFTLAVNQHDDRLHEKRQQVGATIVILCLSAPIILGIGTLVMWFLPVFFEVEDIYVKDVQLALVVGLVGILVAEFASIPNNVLRGVNLEYKSIGLRAIVSLLASVLSVIAISLGLGLPGLSAATAVVPLMSGAIAYIIIRRHVSWWGVSKPPIHTLKRMSQRTFWSFLASLGYLLQNSSDVLLIGLVLGPSSAAVYGTTSAVLRMASEPLFSSASGANSGIAGLCGKGEWRRVIAARNEIHLLALISLVVVGTGVIALNQSFIFLWVGSSLYAGALVNFLLVLLAVQSIPLKLDVMLIDGMLMFKHRAIATAVSSCLGLLLGVFLARASGMAGILMGIMVGNALAILSYQVMIQHVTHFEMGSYLVWIARPVFVGLALFLLALFIHPVATNWPTFFLSGIAVASLSTSVVWLIGLGQIQRQLVRTRVELQFSAVWSNFWANL